MKNLLTFLLLRLVDHPEDVDVTEHKNEDVDEYILKVHQEDMGRVIGKHGVVIQAIRQIAKVRAMKENRRVVISLAEDTVAEDLEN